ncbi:unannotated protein [freshwater metagenome]|uniref:Unannotated protein n=1 Tax=freshwater metagenome TaxID=449393 RepID=A0A6J7QT37_9ZZZZ
MRRGIDGRLGRFVQEPSTWFGGQHRDYEFGDRATVRADQPHASWIGAQRLDHRRKAVHRIATPRPTTEPHSTGQRQRAVRIEPELSRLYLHCGGEARIEIDVCGVAAGAAGKRGDRSADFAGEHRVVQFEPFGDRPRFAARGGQREHPTVGGDAERRRSLDGHHDDRGSHVDLFVRHHELRIRRPHVAIRRRGRGDLDRSVHGPVPGIGVRLRCHAAPFGETTEVLLVLRWGVAQHPPQRLFEKRVLLDGPNDPECLLGRMHELDERSVLGGRRRVRWLGREPDRFAGPLCQRSRVPRFAGHEQYGVVRAGLDFLAGTHERGAWCLAAPLHDNVLTRRDARELCHQQRRVQVLARGQRTHQSNRIDARRDPGTPGIGERGARCGGQQRRRLERRFAEIDTLGVLPRGHEHRTPRIDRCHGSSVARYERIAKDHQR